ncbi:hypothetical protein Y1Q_0001850 [Alligator mississippiensis]|uniref:Uncharacterized protein n=1 Tax=Alligator mississippiensis TaxID=8496 RepID=A0A151MMP1_ALLMI|nr:hypothetical protein Y1Q_0001850 [Alligator mississippiensis]
MQPLGRVSRDKNKTRVVIDTYKAHKEKTVRCQGMERGRRGFDTRVQRAQGSGQTPQPLKDQSPATIAS